MATYIGEMQKLVIGDKEYSLPSSGGSGTVTSVGLTNATNGGLTISGSPITSSGSITVGHSNVLTSAQTTQAVYPIKIDKNGHISAYGSAVSIPSSAANGTTGISVSDHSTTTIYGVSSSTTSVTGVSGSTSIYGVKSGTNSTTTASKASGGNGTASSWTFEEKTIPNVTAAGSGSYTQGSFSGGSGSFSATVTSHILSFSHTHTAATHGTDSHTHTAPTIGTAIKVQSKSGGSNGSASTWSFTDVTVPIRADSATTVPTAASSATTVPIKNSSSTTVVTSKTHTITDNGHTHTLS